MATGRTSRKHVRFYLDGYDLSGYSISVGPLELSYDTSPMAALTDEAQGVLPNHAHAKIGTLNGFFDPTTTGIHDKLNAPGSPQKVMIPIGIRAAPAQGDPVFSRIPTQLNYYAVPGDGFVTVSIEFGEEVASFAETAVANVYRDGWGVLLHARGDETAVNGAIGVDDNGGSSAFGGLFSYQLFSSNGTVTLRAQDAAVNTDPSFANITAATSGVIDASVTPVGNVIPVNKTLTIRQFLRWQLALGTATTCNFAIAFIRGRG